MEKKTSVTAVIKKMGIVFLCLFFFDCACTGSGRYVTVGPLTPRILLAGLIMLCAAVPFFVNIEKQIKNPVNWLILLFLFYMIFEVFRGQAFGNNQSVLATDVKGFIYLLLIPGMLALITEQKDVRHIVNAVLAGSSLQALFCVASNVFLSAIAPSFYEAFVEGIWSVNWGTILPCEYGAYRIFCKSSIYLIAACAILLGRIVRAEKIGAVTGYGALFLLNAEAIMLTYTRSIYLTTGVVFLLTFVFCLFTLPAKKVLLRTLLFIVLFLGITYGQELLLHQGIFQYACARCFHFDLNAHLPLPHTWEEGEVDMTEITANSNETRAATVNGLKAIIRQYPLIGRGLGATSEARDGADEYFYLDMLARMGIVGLALYLLPALLAYIRLLRKGTAKKAPETWIIFIGLIGFLIATYFNPWMNAALGIAWYGLTAAAVWTLSARSEEGPEFLEVK